MPGRPSRPHARRIGALAALVLACGGGLAACGQDAETTYADGWDDVCRAVGGAMGDFRTAVSSAAVESPDAGDAQVARGATPAAVTGDLLKPARALQEDLAEQARAARALDPPPEWAAWHARELRELAVRLRSVDDGVRRIGRGDADALPLLAVGSIGPASVRAPAALRDRTPECTVLR
jgi:hypothetical protein